MTDEALFNDWTLWGAVYQWQTRTTVWEAERVLLYEARHERLWEDAS